MCLVLGITEIRPVWIWRCGEHAVRTPQDGAGTVLGMSGMIRNGTEFQACETVKNTGSFFYQPSGLGAAYPRLFALSVKP